MRYTSHTKHCNNPGGHCYWEGGHTQDIHVSSAIEIAIASLEINSWVFLACFQQILQVSKKNVYPLVNYHNNGSPPFQKKEI